MTITHKEAGIGVIRTGTVKSINGTFPRRIIAFSKILE
jgi:hypothetical protein